MPNVKGIIVEYLKEHGFDGLFNESGECGCELEDLAPCWNLGEDCEPGFKVPCDCGDHDFHIEPVKCAGTPKLPKPLKDLETAVLATVAAWEAWISGHIGQLHLNLSVGPGKAVADAMKALKIAAVEIIRKDVEGR